MASTRTPASAALPTAAGSALAAVGTASPASAASSARKGHPGHARAQHRPATVATALTPIATTITRIVGVVPNWVWIVLGVLSALALGLAARSRLVATRARQLERQRAELLADVGVLQAALLPELPARLGPVATSAAYRPADGPGAGGDFYDMFGLQDGRLAVIVGDLSGHGRPALPHTALVRYTLRAYLEAGLSPRVAVQTAGAVLARQLGESFATVIAATYNPRERILTYSCAGHPPPIVLGGDSLPAIIPITAASSPPIGVGMRAGTRQTTVSLPGRGTVCFFTDGLTDARIDGKQYGAERLARALAELESGEGAPALLERVAGQTDARPDDMAACLLCVDGDSCATPSVLAEELELDRDEVGGDRLERFLLAGHVERSEIPRVIHSARAGVMSAGTAVLELHRTAGAPTVSLRRENVAPLDLHQARRRAGIGGSL